MTAPGLEAIRASLEGYVPAVLATCDEAGVPNVSLISQVHYVDPERVALSYQFFNKTRRNLLATGTAAVSAYDPVAMIDYRLDLDYEETRTDGPLFEIMKARLAGIASHSGMEGVFQLRGADIMRVRAITALPGRAAGPPAASSGLLGAVRRSFATMREAPELGALLDRTLAALRAEFGIEHAMILMLDETGARLYTVASTGYPRNGIGAEIAVGQGVIGVAARERVPIRIGHMSAEYSYDAAVRDEARDQGIVAAELTEIAYPGLAAPESQIALPLLAGERLLGTLLAESPQPMRFCYEDEDALALIAERLAELILAVQRRETAPALPQREAAPLRARKPIVVRHYQADDSIFLGHDYLIKGVAGAIFWKLAREHVATGRREFTNRELRLDPALRLPAYAENLEARLLLLQRRLRERASEIGIERCGRGRFRFDVPGKLVLEEIAQPGAQSGIQPGTQTGTQPAA